jgi:hypothetical protein
VNPIQRQAPRHPFVELNPVDKQSLDQNPEAGASTPAKASVKMHPLDNQTDPITHQKPSKASARSSKKKKLKEQIILEMVGIKRSKGPTKFAKTISVSSGSKRIPAPRVGGAPRTGGRGVIGTAFNAGVRRFGSWAAGKLINREFGPGPKPTPSPDKKFESDVEAGVRREKVKAAIKARMADSGSGTPRMPDDLRNQLGSKDAASKFYEKRKADVDKKYGRKLAQGTKEGQPVEESVRITASTSNRSLAQIARHHKRDEIGRRAKAELARRKAAKAKEPKARDIGAHFADLAVGKRRKFDPKLAQHLKKASRRTIHIAVKKAVAQSQQERPIKSLQRKLKKQTEVNAAIMKELRRTKRGKGKVAKLSNPPPLQPGKLSNLAVQDALKAVGVYGSQPDQHIAGHKGPPVRQGIVYNPVAPLKVDALPAKVPAEVQRELDMKRLRDANIRSLEAEKRVGFWDRLASKSENDEWDKYARQQRKKRG